MARKHERTAARRRAAQVLYSGSIRNTDSFQLLKDGGIMCLDAPLSDYACRLIQGVEAHREEIDSWLSSISENWALDRMPLMDLAILRIALFEMLYVDEVPISVSINEAVELAKVFGGEDDSPRFVNGLLGNAARRMEALPDSGDQDNE